MAKLTGTLHGDAANRLLSFYHEQAKDLEASGHYFMAAIALAFAIETAVLTYLLVEFGDDNGGELKIPSSVGFYDLVEAAHEIDVLGAPINIPSHVREDGEPPKYIAKEAARQDTGISQSNPSCTRAERRLRSQNIHSRPTQGALGTIRIHHAQPHVLPLATLVHVMFAHRNLQLTTKIEALVCANSQKG